MCVAVVFGVGFFLLLCFVHKPLRLASLDIVFRGFVFVGEASFMFHFPLSLGRSSFFFYSFIYLLHFFFFLQIPDVALTWFGEQICVMLKQVRSPEFTLCGYRGNKPSIN